MAGFAAIYESGTSAQERENEFIRLLDATVKFKQLNDSSSVAIGNSCTAAKLDAPSSLHRGIVHDKNSGSWLMAIGTVVALEGNNHPQLLLERLLLEYLEQGTKALDLYDGHFVLAIYNARDLSMSILSDPMGLFAVYYSQRGSQVLISTSALAIASQISSKVDTLTIECFLRTGRPYCEKTFWQDVKRIKPATALIITSNGVLKKEYWSLKFDQDISNLNLKDALQLADAKIQNTFEKFIDREGKVWADLTGGFDTRVTSMYLSKMGYPFTAYCVGPAGHPDVEISKLVGQEMGWEYQHMPLPDHWVDENYPWFDVALGKGDGHLSVFQLAETLRGQQERSNLYKVHVTGGGVDEWRYHIYSSNVIFPGNSTKLNMKNMLDRRILFGIPQWIMKTDRTSEVRLELTQYLSNLTTDFSKNNSLIQTDVIFRRYQRPVHTGAYISAESGILRGLTPFCSKELEVFGMSLNHFWRIQYHVKFVRNLIEKNNFRLSSIKTALGGPAMPIRLSNVFQFMDLWQYLIEHFTNKTARKLKGSFKRKLTTQNELSLSLTASRIGWLNWVNSERLLEPSQMRSGALYNMPEKLDLLSQSALEFGHFHEFIDRMITVEMALRATDTSVE